MKNKKKTKCLDLNRGNKQQINWFIKTIQEAKLRQNFRLGSISRKYRYQIQI